MDSDSVRQCPTAVRQSGWCASALTVRQSDSCPTVVRQSSDSWSDSKLRQCPTASDSPTVCQTVPTARAQGHGLRGGAPHANAHGGHEVVRGRSACTIWPQVLMHCHMEQMVASRMVEWSLPMAPMTSPNLARTMSVPHVAWVDRLRAGQLDAAPPEKTPKTVSHSETLFHISKHGSVTEGGTQP